MGEPIAILCRNPLDRTDVATFIVEHGGWTKEEDNQVGGVSAGDAHVWFLFDRKHAERSATMELVGDDVVRRLGGPYGSSVTLEVSRVEGSQSLALDLAISCCERWAPALAYDCDETLLSLDELIRMRAEGRTFIDLENELLAREGFGGAN